MEDKKTVEGEIVSVSKADIMPRSVSLTPNQLRKQMARDEEMRTVINEYIKNNMVEGKDYGTITIKGRDGREHISKPSLFKPGAEKFCGLFKIRATFERDQDTVEMLGNTPGIIAYLCHLVDGQGRIIGEGRGTAKADVQGFDFDINKQVKIAQKRAQIDAVLRAGGLSDFFTQDMEDAPRDNTGNDSPATNKQRDLISKKLKESGVRSEEQRGYLIEQFGVEVPLTKEGASFVIGELIGERS